MTDAILKDVNETFRGKAFLTIDEAALILQCSPDVIYNWTKEKESRKRPPRIMVGKEIRFPKQEFVCWLVKNKKL